MAKKSLEPLLWSLFSAGGVLAALFLPIHLLLFGIAVPLGLLAGPTHAYLHTLLVHPLTRIYLFFLCMLALFHGGHRLRFTLYDGLQIKHLNEVIAVLCYGGAIVGTVWAGYLLLQVS
jgi:fumarate reductase subunit D